MNARPILLAGCLFALPAFLSAQGAPVRDSTAQLRAAVEKLRADDLTPAERARLMDTLKKLHEKLAQVHGDDAQEQAKAVYGRVQDQARKAQADEEVARVYERAARAHAEKAPADDASAHERALRTYSVNRDKTAAAEKAMTEHKAEVDHADTLVKRLRVLHQAEGEAAQGQDKAAAEHVRGLLRARDAERAAGDQQPGAVAQGRGPAAQDPEIRELIAQVRRQLAEVRRLMDDIRRRMDAPEGARGRLPGRGAASGQGVAPSSVNRNQALPPAPVQPPAFAPDQPGQAPAAPRARRRGADAESQPTPPVTPAPPATTPRRRTADAAPGMPGGGAWPVSAPELPAAGSGTPPPPPAATPHDFPLPSVGGVSGVSTPVTR